MSNIKVKKLRTFTAKPDRAGFENIFKSNNGCRFKCPLCNHDVIVEAVNIELGRIVENFKCNSCSFEWKEEIDLDENAIVK